MWISFKVFIEFVTILLLFCVLVVLATRHVGSQLPKEGSNLPLMLWKVKSEPLDHQGSLYTSLKNKKA